MKIYNKIIMTSLMTLFIAPMVSAVTEYSSNAQGLFWIGLIGFWLVLLYMSFTMKGRNGQPIGLIVLLQLLFGVVIGTGFLKFSILIGTGVIGVSAGVMVGIWMDSR